MVLAHLTRSSRRTPWGDLEFMHREFDRLFTPLGTCRPPDQAPAESFVRPDGALLRIRVPGLAQESLGLTVLDDSLVLTAKREGSDEPLFVRRFRVGFPVHAEGVDAVLKDGLLEVRLPKLPEHAPRTIEIR